MLNQEIASPTYLLPDARLWINITNMITSWKSSMWLNSSHKALYISGSNCYKGEYDLDYKSLELSVLILMIIQILFLFSGNLCIMHNWLPINIDSVSFLFTLF